MNYPLYWIGMRESEIRETNGLFTGSITIFGSGKNGNRAFEKSRQLRFDYNNAFADWDKFVSEHAEKILQEAPDCRFMLYEPEELGAYGPAVAEHAVCQNAEPLIELLGDKFKTRQWLKEYAPILPYWMCSGGRLGYSDLCRAFPGTDTFVIQASNSCGGSGTFLMTPETSGQVLDKLEEDALYAASPYVKNSVSPNVHLVIYSDSVLLLPPSVQLLAPGTDGFFYRGADFSMYQDLPAKVDHAIKGYAEAIGNVLRKAGYRGICGIDFLVSGNDVYFMEVNARFQSSTFLINRALRDARAEESAQSLHLHAFYGEAEDKLPLSLDVPYSFFHYSYEPRYHAQLKYIHKLMQSSSLVECIDDGLDWRERLDANTSLFKVVWSRNIAVYSPEGRCRVHGNVGLESVRFSPKELEKDVERLKLLLLSHGVRLSRSAERLLSAGRGFNHEEFDALDLAVREHIYICAPYASNLSQLSPFCVEAAPDGSFFLSHYGRKVTAVRIRPPDDLGKNTTIHGVALHDITYLTNDRLRVYHRPGCYFKECGMGCAFCDVPKESVGFDLQDILQAVDAYRNHPKVRHYLVGGGSAAPDDGFDTVASICKHIHDTTGKPIYLMALPPQPPKILRRLYDAGVTEVAFNLELFDRTLAKRYMLGKGAIPLSAYEAAFEQAVQLWGKTGNVRTLFVVGLEPANSLLRGIEYAARLGVAPILSLFRPMADTPLERYLAPADDEIWRIYQQAKDICRMYGLELGPSCPYCEDNVLKITL